MPTNIKVLRVRLPTTLKLLQEQVKQTFKDTPKASLVVTPAVDGSVSVQISVRPPKLKNKKPKAYM